MSMKNVEDVYPLTPMQEVMLLHALSSGGEDALFNQFCYEIEGDLDVPAFERAWRQLVERHSALRTAFVWKDLKQPLQVVRKTVELPVTVLDWRDRSEAERETELDRLRESDRGRPFDPSTAPLLRVTLIRYPDGRFGMIWSSHHLILDRWCLAGVFGDLFAFYETNRGGSSAPVSPGSVGRFRDYVAWIRDQDASAARAFWRRTLHGFTASTPLASRRAASEASEASPSSSHRLQISARTSEAIRTFARGQGMTVGTVFQGAWALVLNQLTSRQDVAFGATVSGRTPDVPRVETIVGSFINNVPVRIQMPGDVTLVEWLKEIQSSQQERLSFEHLSLSAIHECGSLPPDQDLFDHLLVWLAPADGPSPDGLQIRGLPGKLTTAYPLTLGVSESGAEIEVTATWQGARRPLAEIPDMLARLEGALEAVASAGPEQSLKGIDGFRTQPDFDLAPVPSVVASPHVSARNGSNPVFAVEPVAGGREAIEEELLHDLILADWHDVLGLDAVGPDDNFFDLGGNSILAAKLHSRVQAATRLAVPLLSLFQDPTPRAMMRTLQERDWPLTPQMVTPVRTQGDRVPLFCIASPEVNTVGYTLLARHLDPDQPVYVIQSQPSTDKAKRLNPSDLLDLTSGYVEAMRAIQGEGPHQLVGMCSGAHLTLAMARELREGGQDPGFVGIINTWAFYTRTRMYHLDRMRRRLGYYSRRARALLQLRPEERLARLRAIAGRRVASTTRKVVAVTGSERRDVSPYPADPWIDEVGWARKDIGPKYPGAMTVFRIRKRQAGRVRDQDLGWGRHVENVQVEYLSGDDHNAILREPHVQGLAERLQACLQAATYRTAS